MKVDGLNTQIIRRGWLRWDADDYFAEHQKSRGRQRQRHRLRAWKRAIAVGRQYGAECGSNRLSYTRWPDQRPRRDSPCDSGCYTVSFQFHG